MPERRQPRPARVAVCYLARRDYRGLHSPYSPPEAYPDLPFLAGGALDPDNSVYAGVRRVLAEMGLDRERFGRPEWNPLGDLVGPGRTIVIKPNLVRHFNGREGEDIDSVVTHGSVLRPLIDYSWKALEYRGRVIIADASQHDCDVDVIKRYLGFEELRRFYEECPGRRLEFLDLRRQRVWCRDGIIVEREELPGDPLGCRAVDLGSGSAFASLPRSSADLRGSDYDVTETASHHSGGRHEYLVSRTILEADLVINVPKMKTHKKAGVTLALKNLVGINVDKNWLPHYRAGFPEGGGDEYPARDSAMAFRHWMVERCRPLLDRSLCLGFFRWARRMERRGFGSDFLRAGNWYGNDTVWRMVLDLNRVFYFADREGRPGPERSRDRKSFSICDGVVAGDGEGPMSTSRKPLGVLSGSMDPLALDLALLEIMGLDWKGVPKIARAMDEAGQWLAGVTGPEDVIVVEVDRRSAERVRRCGLDGIRLREPFGPPKGWIGRLEKEPGGVEGEPVASARGEV